MVAKVFEVVSMQLLRYLGWLLGCCYMVGRKTPISFNFKIVLHRSFTIFIFNFIFFHNGNLTFFARSLCKYWVGTSAAMLDDFGSWRKK